MLTLLIIDDNESIRYALAEAFKRLSFAVVTASDGSEGVTRAKQGGIDAALVDIQMPGLNGIDVCLELTEWAHQNRCDLPVWLMTGAGTDDLRTLGTAAGAVAVYDKPFDPAKLAVEIRDRVAISRR